MALQKKSKMKCVGIVEFSNCQMKRGTGELQSIRFFRELSFIIMIYTWDIVAGISFLQEMG
ncbi:hypothetical protein HMPREF1986_01026 [Oribacterium sp. oral taxon 078 str. F0263]|nr:hypothetical protein HMPREF1986_01026 [Oribacterium sp. oral taxon 078 str. F0263]